MTLVAHLHELLTECWAGRARDAAPLSCSSVSEARSEPLAELAARAEQGDPAAADPLFAALYDELHRLARAHLRGSAGPLTLGATTLLHEAYLGIAQRDSLAFPDRNRFFAYASRAMRWIVIDFVRPRRAHKRGGELTFAPLDEEVIAGPESSVELERLGDALGDLAKLDPGLAELVDLKYFCGFSFAEIAALRGVSERTAQRDWEKARLVLHEFLSEA